MPIALTIQLTAYKAHGADTQIFLDIERSFLIRTLHQPIGHPSNVLIENRVVRLQNVEMKAGIQLFAMKIPVVRCDAILNQFEFRTRAQTDRM